MAFLKKLLPLLLMPLLLNGSSAEAGSQKPKKTIPEKAQIPFSFIAPTQRSQTLSKLQSTLQARVVQQSPAQPVYTQVFLSAPQPITSSTYPPAQPVAVPTASPPQKNVPKRLFKLDYPERSWIQDITEPQAAALAANMTEFLAKQMPPQATTLILAQPNKKQLKNPLTPLLETQLRQNGFTLATTRREAPLAQLVCYQVHTLNWGILVQIHTPNQWISRYYPVTSTQALMATHPFSIRTLGEANP